MSEGSDPRPAIHPALFWRVLVVGNLTSLAVLLFVFNRMMQSAAQPAFGLWLFAAGAVLAIPAFLYHGRAERKRRQLQREGKSENAIKLAEFNQVVIACGLAELPGLFGTVYYLFAREWQGTLLLLALTVLLLMRARPRT
jgi:hypothetical protein